MAIHGMIVVYNILTNRSRVLNMRNTCSARARALLCKFQLVIRWPTLSSLASRWWLQIRSMCSLSGKVIPLCLVPMSRLKTRDGEVNEWRSLGPRRCMQAPSFKRAAKRRNVMLILFITVIQGFKHSSKCVNLSNVIKRFENSGINCFFL